MTRRKGAVKREGEMAREARALTGEVNQLLTNERGHRRFSRVSDEEWRAARAADDEEAREGGEAGL